MNTEQSYVGGGNNTLQTSSTAKKLANTAPPPDQRSELTPPPGVDPSVWEAQTNLLDLVDNFLQAGNAAGPIEAINELLYHWLTTPATDLSRQLNRNQLHTALQLVNFLSALYESNLNRHYFASQAEQKGGVSHA